MINWFERKPIRNWTFTRVKVEKKNKAKEGEKNVIRVNFNPMLVKCIKIMSTEVNIYQTLPPPRPAPPISGINPN